MNRSLNSRKIFLTTDTLVYLGNDASLIIFSSSKKHFEPTDKQQEDIISFNVTQQIRTFVGRQNEIKQINNLIKKRDVCRYLRNGWSR